MRVLRRFGLRTRFLLCSVIVVLAFSLAVPGILGFAQGAKRFAGTITSAPVAINADDTLLVVANPDNDSVTLFNVGGDQNTKIAEVKVGKEPNGVSMTPDGQFIYVSNTVDGTVSVLQVQGTAASVVATLEVGVEPYGVAATPNGTKVYVTNARSNSVSVIDTKTNKVVKTIANIGPAVGAEPRGIAVTNNGNEKDDDETVYVTHFYAFPTNKLDGEDDSKTGLVTRISTANDSVAGPIVLKNMPDTGFKSGGNAIAKQITQDFNTVTGAYPNQIHSVGVKGQFLYLPNTGASPNGPVRFNVNTQSLVHVISLANNQDTGKTFNLHKAVASQPEGTQKIFPTIPWAIAFKSKENVGYVVSASSNIVIKIQTDPATGVITVPTRQDTKRVADIQVGRNPRGIIINNADTRAYVANYISRDVTVIDITRFPEQVVGTLRSAAIPAAGSPEELAWAGKELYNTSIGEFENSAGNMSSEGWGSCASCHPFGLADNVVWIFAAGPRRTISQHQDFAGGTQRALNWSGIFDEEHDFELNIRGVSGGKGLLLKADGSNQLEDGAKLGGLVLGTPPALAPANSKLPQLKFRTGAGSLVFAWDAIVAYEKTIRSPIAPLAKSQDPDIAEGRNLFTQNNCQSCHGGPRWSISTIAGPIADIKELKAGQIVAQLKNVGTFNPADKNEVRANGQPPLGADGFVPPSLLGISSFPPYYHNGTANSLEEVLGDKFIPHRSAGTGGVDGLTNADDRRKLVKFLQSIDASTEPINP